MSTINIFQISLEIWGCLMCTCAAVLSSGRVFVIGGTIKHVWKMLLVNALMLTFETFSYIFDGDMRSFGVDMTRIANFCLLFSEGTLTYYYISMVENIIDKGSFLKHKSSWVKICIALVGIQIIGTVITPFTDFYYSFSETNLYQRQPGIYVSFVTLGIAFAICSVQLYRHRNILSFGFANAVRLSIAVFAVCFIIQMLVYNLSLLSIGITSVLLMLLTALWSDNLQHEHEAQLESMEKAIKELLELVDAKK